MGIIGNPYCEACITNCAKCSDTYDNCLQCDSDFYFNPFNKQCIEDCTTLGAYFHAAISLR